MQEWSFDWWDVTCILGTMALSLLLAFRLSQILAGISEIEEVSPASTDCVTSCRSPSPKGRSSRSPRRRKSSSTSSTQREKHDVEKEEEEGEEGEEDDGQDDEEEVVGEELKLEGVLENNNYYGDEFTFAANSSNSDSTSRRRSSDAGCVSLYPRQRSTSDSRSPVRHLLRSASNIPSAVNTSTSTSTTSVVLPGVYSSISTTSSASPGPSSTCSSPRHPASHRARRPGHPRRSLSLPNGGLSYGGDVKILYRDGHFVTVVDPAHPNVTAATASSSTNLRDETNEDDYNSVTVSSTSSSPRRPSSTTTTLTTNSNNNSAAAAAAAANLLASQLLKTGATSSGGDPAVKSSMRAEILALLERGITDPQRILAEACCLSSSLQPDGGNYETLPPQPVSHTQAVASCSSSSSSSSSVNDGRKVAPLFHSLPRRKGHKGGNRPVSVDEAQLSKFQSKSHQSLVGPTGAEMEQDADGAEWEDRMMMSMAKERSVVKRNKSFNEAMGTRVDFNARLGEREEGDVEAKMRELEARSIQRRTSTCEEDSKLAGGGGKSRGSKGPGFIQRMLQKRKGSTADKPPLSLAPATTAMGTSREDLRGSTVSLPLSAPIAGHQQQQPGGKLVAAGPSSAGGRDNNRDTSVGRKMSLRGIFRRKNSADMSSATTLLRDGSSAEESGSGSSSNVNGSPPIARFLNNDDIGALTTCPPTPSTAVQRRLPQRAENGEPYTVPPGDDSDPLSLSYPAAAVTTRSSRPPRGPGHHTSSSSLHSGHSVSHDDAAEESGDVVFPRRARSSSGRGRSQPQSQTLLQSPVLPHSSPSSPSSSSMSSPPSSLSSRVILAHNSWSSDLDIASPSSGDTVTTSTSRSVSPGNRHHRPIPTSASCTPTPADYSFSSVSEGEATLLASPDDGRLSPPVYRTLTYSPVGGRRRQQPQSPAAAVDTDRGFPVLPPSSSPSASLHRELEGEGEDTSREITSSNSNDSGIQHDANVTSSAESITTGVRLRETSKSPSPSSSASSRRGSAHHCGERPKSDTTVHWADLLEQVMGVTSGGAGMRGGAVRRRHEAGGLRRRPRPKSDIEWLDLEATDDILLDISCDLLDAGSHIPESRVVDHLTVTNSLGNLSGSTSTMLDNSNIITSNTTAGNSNSSSHQHHRYRGKSSSCSSMPMVNNSNNNSSSNSNSNLYGAADATDSLANLVVEMRASSSSSSSASLSNRHALLSAKLNKFRRLSTPQPITLRVEKPRPSTHPAATATTSTTTTINNNNASQDSLTSPTSTLSPTGDLELASRLADPSSPLSSSSSGLLPSSSSAISSLGGGGGGGVSQGIPASSHSSYLLSSTSSAATRPRHRGGSRLAHAHSMPDNLDKLTRKRHFFSMLGSDSHSVVNHRTSLEAADDDDDGDSSDDSESSYSITGNYRREKCRSARSSRLMLAALDQMLEAENLTYAEALWDHVTMDPEELGFRAGDLIRVTDCQDKHWWFGVLDDTEGWFPAAFVRLRVNQDLMDNDFDFLLSAGALTIVGDTANLISSANNINNNNNNGDILGLLGSRSTLLQQAAPPGQGGGQQTQKVSAVTAPPGGTSGGGGYLDNHQARANVVNEIISAEREYVKHLRDVVEGYVKQARKRPEMFPRDKVNTIFSNIEEIYEFATDLLVELEESINSEQPHLSQLGRCFLGSINKFEMYSDYCNNHPAACEELRELYRNKRYRHFFEACRLLQEMIEIPLEGFLLTPVQKICKYHLQLAELLKFTPPSHPDHAGTRDALEAMKRIATLINERKRKMESVEKLAAWQLLVDDWEGPDILEGSSELIYSGELNKVNHAGWSQERYFFLFDHQLIYCKKDLLKKSGFGYKGRILMDACSVVNVPDGRETQYNVSVRNAWKLHDATRDKWYLLVAKTEVAKQRWLKAFQDERQRVKEDAENNFNIPSHVKDAVVTNFRQKANLNKPKGRAKFSRTSSTQSFSTYSSDVSAIATLPRNKGRQKAKVKLEDDSSSNAGKSGGGGAGGKKITRFFLGKGKS